MLTDGKCSHGVREGNDCLLCGCTVGATYDPPKHPRPPKAVMEEDVALLLEYLSDKRDWLTSKKILSALADLTSEDVHRFCGSSGRDHLRHMAKASRGKVLSGQKGYKLTLQSTVNEVQGCADALMQAGQGIMDRRADILHVFHKGKSKGE